MLRVLANGGIFPGIFLGTSVEMVLAGMKERYPFNSQEYLSPRPAIAPFPLIFLGIFLGISLR